MRRSGSDRAPVPEILPTAVHIRPGQFRPAPDLILEVKDFSFNIEQHILAQEWKK